jgi:transposase-like protein
MHRRDVQVDCPKCGVMLIILAGVGGLGERAYLCELCKKTWVRKVKPAVAPLTSPEFPLF